MRKKPFNRRLNPVPPQKNYFFLLFFSQSVHLLLAVIRYMLSAKHFCKFNHWLNRILKRTAAVFSGFCGKHGANTAEHSFRRKAQARLCTAVFRLCAFVRYDS